MFRLKSSIKNENANIPTYYEVVSVKNGIAECRTEAAKNHLLGLGFTLIKEEEKEEKEKEAKKTKKKAKKK